MEAQILKKLQLFILLMIMGFMVNAQSAGIIEIVSPIVETPIQMPSLDAYIIRAEASVDSTRTINGVNFHVDGRKIRATEVDGQYIAIWTPTSYGSKEIIAIMCDDQQNWTYDTSNVMITSTVQDTMVATFDKQHIAFPSPGRSFDTTFYLPQFVGAFDSVIAHFDVTCPPGGCDPWDRVAWIDLKGPDGKWMELLHYITPYNRGCSHRLDVTDYMSLLQGKVEMKIFIDTWVNPAWEVSLTLEYKEGNPAYNHSKVDVLWDGNYKFGDYANLQPLDTLQLDFPSNSMASKMKVVTTGHGWGSTNTGNAAEFYYANHFFEMVGIDTLLQDMQVTCDPNPDACSPQSGTWQFDRAGWCPGAISYPYEYDMSSYMAQAPFEFRYIFEPGYVDLCHPNHPNCVDGTTCPDCSDGIQPHYYIAANLVNWSSSPLETDLLMDANDTNICVSTNISNVEQSWHRLCKVFPNPNEGSFIVDWQFRSDKAHLIVMDLMGKEVMTVTNESVSRLDVDLNDQPEGIYIVKVQTDKGSLVRKVRLKR